MSGGKSWGLKKRKDKGREPIGEVGTHSKPLSMRLSGLLSAPTVRKPYELREKKATFYEDLPQKFVNFYACGFRAQCNRTWILVKSYLKCTDPKS